MSIMAILENNWNHDNQNNDEEVHEHKQLEINDSIIDSKKIKLLQKYPHLGRK